MQGIGHAFVLMCYDGDLDELWIGICLLSPELAQLIVSIFTHTHTHIYRDKILNDVERYVKLLRRREKKGQRRDAIASSSEWESYQSGSMHVNEPIDRWADQCRIYNTREG